MNISEKLNWLFSITGVSGAQVAKALNVDASLVSRWRKGSRTPEKNPEYMKDISAFFASRIRQDYQKRLVSDMLGIDSFPDEATLQENLLSWMTLESSVAKQFLDGVFQNRWLISDEKDPAVHISLLPAASNRVMFTGAKGLLEAFSILLLLASQDHKDHDVYFFLDSPISVEEQISEVLHLASEMLPGVLGNSGRVKIIHSLSKSIPDFFTNMDMWLPIYFRYQVESYWWPGYRSDFFEHVILSVPEVAVVTCHSAIGFPEVRCILNTSREAVRSVSEEFLFILSQCRPLLYFLSPSSNLEAVQRMINFTLLQGNTFYMGNMLSLFSMPITLLTEHMPFAALNKEETSVLNRETDKYEEALSRYLSKNDLHVMAPLYSPEEIRTGQVVIPSFDRHTGARHYYSENTYLRHLSHLSDMLEHYPRFHLYVIDKLPHDICAIAKKGGDAILSINHERGASSYYTNRNTHANALYDYLESIFLALPQDVHARVRNKEVLRKAMNNFRAYR